MLPRSLATALVACVFLCAAPPAGAEEATGGEVAVLARAAASGDEAALRKLRTLDEVDGRPVDLESALQASGPTLTSRLQMLAREPTVGLANAQDIARDILSERRFQPTDLPQPLRAPLEALADRLRELGRPLGSLVDALPGEGSTEWVVIAILVAVVSGIVALRLGQRRARLQSRRSIAALHAKHPDPRSLETEAARAEAEGDLERALRLRFAAGLIRLDRNRAIQFNPSLTTGDVSRLLGSKDFDRVAVIFDEVVYGKRRATPTDVSEAREHWDRVLARSGRP
jgi:hypothetical protein